MTRSYRVFVAFPFNGATTPMYKSILAELDGKHGIHFTFTYGNSSTIASSPRLDTYQLFKQQNADLLSQFYANIKSADIVVADLTHNNPNVHVELGIAITLNKNILRVSSRDMVEVGSDVKGYDVSRYSNRDELLALLAQYLDTFLAIKSLPLESAAGAFYRSHVHHTQALQLKATPEMRVPFHHVTMPDKTRDLGLRAKFKFIVAKDQSDWFGVYLRHGAPNPWAGGSYLVYLRANGSLELAELPNATIIKEVQLGAVEIGREYVLDVTCDGGRIQARLDSSEAIELDVENLDIVTPGWISIGSHDSEISVSSLETVCRDTVQWKWQ